MRPTTSNKPGAAGHGRRVLPAEGGQRGQWQMPGMPQLLPDAQKTDQFDVHV